MGLLKSASLRVVMPVEVRLPTAGSSQTPRKRDPHWELLLLKRDKFIIQRTLSSQHYLNFRTFRLSKQIRKQRPFSLRKGSFKPKEKKFCRQKVSTLSTYRHIQEYRGKGHSLLELTRRLTACWNS